MAHLELYNYFALCCDGCKKEGPRVTDPRREDEESPRGRGSEWDEGDVRRAMKEGDWKQIGNVTLCAECRKQAGA
jgi:hypothetical protein